MGKLPHRPAHLRGDPVRPRPERQAGPAVARPSLASFTLDTYIHLLDEALPEPVQLVAELGPSAGGASDESEESSLSALMIR